MRDFGAREANPDDDYPHYVIPLARATAAGEVERGIAVCGSGAGTCIAANKVFGARASLVHDVFTAHQAVEDDDIRHLLHVGDSGHYLALMAYLTETNSTESALQALRTQLRDQLDTGEVLLSPATNPIVLRQLGFGLANVK